MGRFNGLVGNPQVMKIGDRGGQGGAQTGDGDGSLILEVPHVAARQSMQDQGVRIADALDPGHLDDARVGNGQQHVRLMVKPDAIVVGQWSFVDQIRLLVGRDQHETITT